MTHIRRQTVLDLHHNILPETARLRTWAEPILARARPLPEFPRFSIPAPVDLVLQQRDAPLSRGRMGAWPARTSSTSTRCCAHSVRYRASGTSCWRLPAR